MGQGILAAVDFSEITDRVLAEAGRLAKAMRAPLWLLHVVPVVPTLQFGGLENGRGDLTDTWSGRAREDLEGLRKTLTDQGIETVAMVLTGAPVEVLLREAECLEADFLVLGSHGHGMLHNLLAGSVCQGVLRRAPCSVVVVPGRRPDSHLRASLHTVCKHRHSRAAGEYPRNYASTDMTASQSVAMETHDAKSNTEQEH